MVKKKYKTALIMGAGAFGTSIGTVLAHNFERVIFMVRSLELYEDLKKKKNSTYLPSLSIPENIFPALSWEEVEALGSEGGGEVDLLVNGLPTSGIEPFYRENQRTLEHYLKRGIPFISLSKGIDPHSLVMSDDLFFNIFPHWRNSFAFLSGPSFAKEVVQKQITLVSLAGSSRENLFKAMGMFETRFFKCLATYDIKGVLLGGALKNVIAIAGGMIEGLGYNHNTRAALITRAISEMFKFGKVYSARPETFYGLSGMGDLILTTTGGLSRNKTFGWKIAQGSSPREIVEQTKDVIEGYKTTKAVHLLSQKYGIKTLLFHGVYQILYENADIQKTIDQMMKTPSTFES